MIEAADPIEAAEAPGRLHQRTVRSPWRSWRVWLALFGVCTVIGLIEGTQAYLGGLGTRDPAPRWGECLAATMPSWYILGALVPFTFGMARRFPIEDVRWKLSLLVHIPASIIFAVFHLSLATYSSEWLNRIIFDTTPPLTFSASMSQLLGVYFVIEIFFYAMFVGFAHALDYRRQVRERERVAAQLALKTSRLEGSLTRANLESLRMQLNPHFLFNTLNAISVMALKGERHGVVRTLTLLSDLLRVSLENNAQVVALRDEIAFLERYLEIEEIRFKDRLTVRMDLAPDTLDAEVPTLLLQPLVENAIRHGISRKPGAGEIVITSSRQGTDLVLEVRDTGPGFNHSSDNTRTGIGLANTRARLEQLYNAGQTLSLEDADGGGALVRVRLPFRIVTQEATTLSGVGLPSSVHADTLQTI
jgi:signal transduction histidine kinase